MSLSAVSATKYKKTTVKVKFDKKTTKSVGNYKAYTLKERYNDIDIIYAAVAKGKTFIKGNKYYTKVYYKQKGKTKTSKWAKGTSKYDYQYYAVPKTIKVTKVGFKVPVSSKKATKKSKSKSK